MFDRVNFILFMLLIKAFFPRTRNSPRTVRGLFEPAISLVPFCRGRQFTLRDYFAVSCLWLVNLNDVLNMWLLVVSDWSILKIKKKNFAPPGLYPPPCTLPCSVHCPVHLHTGPAPSVYTAFLLKPWPAEIRTRYLGNSRPALYPLHHRVTGAIIANLAI